MHQSTDRISHTTRCGALAGMSNSLIFGPSIEDNLLEIIFNNTLDTVDIMEIFS